MFEYDMSTIPVQKGYLPDFPVKVNAVMKFEEAAVWYSRVILRRDTNKEKHTCPRCGSNLMFQFNKHRKEDPYHDSIKALCKVCGVSSDECLYDHYEQCPANLARGAMQYAIDEFMRRIEARRNV